MALGRRKRECQQELWVATTDVARAPRHVFYERLNQLLSEAGFDAFVEELCEPHYADGKGRPGIPPGIYFRMLFIGYFEAIDSQRGIAWRCEDSLSLREFLGYAVTKETPDHSSLSRVRDRLPIAVHEQVFARMLAIAESKKLLKGRTVAVDSTTLEADAAMKSIVRKDTGEDWKAYIRRLMQDAGLVQEGEEPTDEELRRFDRQRKDKKVSNEEWESPTDPDARIAKMKDGRTHLAYKAEHVVDLDTEFVLAATVFHADEGDAETLPASVVTAQINLIRAGSETDIQDVAGDKGYHKNETLAELSGWGLRSYIPERKQKSRTWTDKPPEQEAAFRANRRRTRGQRGRRLQRQRSERVERSFAHICETGGARRTWLHGLEKTGKRYLVTAMAHNLGLVMRKLFGIGKPREAAAACAAFLACLLALRRLQEALQNAIHVKSAPFDLPNRFRAVIRRIPETSTVPVYAPA
jgi:transposase